MLGLLWGTGIYAHVNLQPRRNNNASLHMPPQSCEGGNSDTLTPSTFAQKYLPPSSMSVSSTELIIVGLALTIDKAVSGLLFQTYIAILMYVYTNTGLTSQQKNGINEKNGFSDLRYEQMVAIRLLRVSQK